MNSRKIIEVCAAVIRKDAYCLICSRPAKSKWRGYWEFPGGKIEPGETVSQCICRELAEELNLKVLPFDTIWILEHDYPEYSVRVHFVRCIICGDSPLLQHLDGQESRWVRTEDLMQVNLLPADAPLAAWLTKKSFFFIKMYNKNIN